MGRSGIRRRGRKGKGRRRPAPNWDGYDAPPGMMWSAPGDDFDPSSVSPAGSALIGWRLLRSLGWGGRNRRAWIRIATKVVLTGFLVLVLFGYVLSALGR